MIASRRFVLLATSISAALVLSACQPTKENNEAAPKDDIAPPATDIADTQKDIEDEGLIENEDSANDTQMTDMLRDYTRSMTRMHDEMMIGMSYNDPDTAFAKAMLGHHHGAIEMAKIQLKYGTDDVMRQLAQKIIDAQQSEVDILNKWLASHPDASKPKPHTQAMQQAYARSMDVLHGDMILGIADPVPDMAFARGMLPHHIGAVEMAKIQLEYGADEEMRQLAQEIIDTQQAEIRLMQKWIADFEAANNTNDELSENDPSNHDDKLSETEDNVQAPVS